jgi:hypothetical protein
MNRLVDTLQQKVRKGMNGRAEKLGSSGRAEILARIDNLEREMQECRALNRRLADVVDVVAELLVPALDRDDTRVSQALARLDLDR